MTRSTSPRLAGYAGLGAAALLLAVALRNADAAAIGAALLFVPVAALALGRHPRLEATATVERDRAIEGDRLRLAVEVESADGVAWLQVGWPLPRGFAVAAEPGSNVAGAPGSNVAGRGVAGSNVAGAPGSNVAGRGDAGSNVAGRGDAGSNVAGAPGSNLVGVSVPGGEPRTVALEVVATTWGPARLDTPVIRAHDRLGFFRLDGRVGEPRLVRVYPHPETLRASLAPAVTSAFAGNELSRERGDGIEFADVRPYVPGDRPRRVNWRLSSRFRQLHVNETHPERNADVVLFLDAFTDLRAGSHSSFELAVEAASTLAAFYLGRRDRVGVIGFGGAMSWLAPAMGNAQLYRIAEALIESEVFASYVWRGLEVIPQRTLPARSLVVGLTPLLDERTVGAMLDLAARGYDLTIVEVDPESFVSAAASDDGVLAYRIWRLERETLRRRFRELGVPIVRWQRGTQLQPVVKEAEEYRRRARWLHV